MLLRPRADPNQLEQVFDQTWQANATAPPDAHGPMEGRVSGLKRAGGGCEGREGIRTAPA